jgi:hypothetical protein
MTACAHEHNSNTLATVLRLSQGASLKPDEIELLPCLLDPVVQSS